MKRVIRSNKNEQTKQRIQNEKIHRQHKSNNIPPKIIDIFFLVDTVVDTVVDTEVEISASSVFDNKFINGIPKIQHPKSSAKPRMSNADLAEYNSLIKSVCSAIRGPYSKKGLEYIGYKLESNSYSCYIAFTSSTMNEFSQVKYDNWMFRFRISDHFGKGAFAKSEKSVEQLEKDDGLIIFKNIVVGPIGDFADSLQAYNEISKTLRAVASGDLSSL